MANRIQLRRDTAANWTSANPVLALGEAGYETDTKRRKTGDGTTAWNAASYDDAAFAPASGSANYAQTWKPNTAYAQYQQIISPNAEVVTCAVAHTSGTVYAPANWMTSANLAALRSSSVAPGGTAITDYDTFKYLDTSRPITPVKEMATWGHSMMYSNGGGVQAKLTQYLNGLTTYNYGVGGNSSTEIAIRKGGVIPLITFTAGNIPADTSSVAVTVQPSREYLLGSTGSNPYTYAGTVATIPGTLTYSTALHTWSFNRTTAGTLTAVPANTPFLITTPLQNDRLTLIWPGRNNLYSVSGDMRNVCRDVDAMIGTLTPYRKQYLVLSDFTGSDETSNTTNVGKKAIYTETIRSNKERAARYGIRYYDLRRDFIDKGMRMAGLTPTANDLTAIAGDAMPWSLSTADGSHPNDTGYAIIGKLISQYITNNLPDWGLTYTPVNLLTTNQASIETDATGWQGYGDGNVTVAQSTTYASDGSASLLVTAAPSGIASAGITPYVPVTAGKFYAASVQTRAAVTPRARHIEYYWYDTNGAFLSSNQSSATTDTATGWTTIPSTGIVAPANATSLRMVIATAGAVSGEQYYIDNAGVYSVAAAGTAPPAWETP